MTLPHAPTHESAKHEIRAAHATAAAGAGAVWRGFHFPTAQAAVNFANLAPRQVAGEFVMTDSDQGGVDGAFFF